MLRIRISSTIYYKIAKREGLGTLHAGEQRHLPCGAIVEKTERKTFWIISRDKSLVDLPAYIDWRGSSAKHVFPKAPAFPVGAR